MADNNPGTNPQVQVSASLDAAPFEQGAKKVVQAGEKMAEGVGKSAEQAGRAVDGIGTGGQAAAQRVDVATRSITASIQRSTAALQAGERGTAKYHEAMANLRGADVTFLKPYLDQLRQAEAAQAAAGASLSGMSVSARQTAAALRGVPAQFTDIITSLQGGQAPLTVLLQQGGQLKDMFGGAGAAARALGGYVLGLVNPYTVAAAAATGLAVAYTFGAKEAQEFQRTVILSGQLAGVTAGQLSDMAAAVRAIGAGSQGRASEVLAMMAASGEIGAVNLERFTAAALRIEEVGGPAAEETAKAFADLAREPLKASLRLNESTGYLTRSVYEQIKAFEEQGRHVEAATLAQKTWADALDTRTPQLVKNLSAVENAWMAVRKAGKKALDDILDIGRTDGPEAQMKELRSRIALTEAGNYSRSDLPNLRAQLAALEKTAALDAARASAAGEQARQVKLLAEYRKDETQYLPAILRYQNEVTRAVNEGVAAHATSEEIQLRVQAAKKRYEDSFKSGGSGNNKDIEAESAAMAKLLGVTTTYASELQALIRLRDKDKLSLDEFVAQAERLNAVQPYMLTYTRSLEEAAQVRERYLESINKSIDGAAKEAQSLQDQLVQMTMGKEALNERIALRLEDQALAAESAARWTAVTELEAEGYRRLAAQLRDAAKARRELTAGQIEQDLVAANKKAAERALREWQNTSDQIGKGLAGAIIAGGDSAAEYLERLFSTLVLQPIVQAAIQPYVNAGLGALGYAQPTSGSAYGQAAQTAGASGALGASMAGSAYAPYLGYAAVLSVMANQGSKFYEQGFNSGAASRVQGGSLLGATAGVYGDYTAESSRLLGRLGLSDKWADILSGSVAFAKVFGRSAPKLRSSGIQGTIDGGDFTGSLFARFKEEGGLLRSDKNYTKTSLLPDDVGRMLDDSSKALLEKAKEYGRALGLPADALGNLTKDIKIVLGKDAEANKQAILDSLASYGDALVAGWAEALKPVSQYGETTAQTVERVAVSLATVNDVMKQLGLSLFDTSVTGGLAATALSDVFGGLDTLQAASQSYYESFYSDAEKTAKATKGVSEALSAVGLAMPATRDGFRAMVEAADLTTEAGRTQYATLLGVADAFAQITDSGQKLIDAGDGVIKFIAELRGQASGVASLQSARALYGADLLAAQGGDIGATGRITNSAKALVDLIREGAADPVALARETSRIATQLSSLPAVVARQNAGMDALTFGALSQGATSSGMAGAVVATSNPGMSAEISAMREELRTALEAVAKSSAKTASILDRITPDGDAMATRDAGA